MFREIMPGVKWVNNSHADTRGGNTCGIPVGYNTSVYIDFFPPPGGARADKGAKGGRYYGWKYKTDIFPRSHGPALDQPLYHSSTLAQHRAELEGALQANCSGIGRTGADFWEVLSPPPTGKRTTGKRSETIIGRYQETCWNQLNMNTSTEAFLAPGPEGAVSTERFENLREGAQLCEARILLERAILDGKLSGEPAKKCQEVLDERAWHLRSACAGNSWGWNWWAGASPGLDEQLFAAAAEAVAKLGGK
jgi:hypothetical protein